MTAPSEDRRSLIRRGEETGTDDQLLKLWLHGKSRHTSDAYRRDVKQFVRFVDIPLKEVTLADLQNWAGFLSAKGLARSTQARKLAAVKSLFSFGHRLGYFPFNVGAALTLPKVHDKLAERILSEAIIQRVLHMAKSERNAVMLRLFYASGGRVSELASLHWRAVIERRGSEGQVQLTGKGDKTRNVLLSSATWSELVNLRVSEREAGYGAPEDPVFRSRKGGCLSRQQIWRIVKDAAERAGAPDAVSPHWLRHAHASHALDRGAPAHLVKETLGHQSLVTTSRYTHARPDDSSAKYLGV